MTEVGEVSKLIFFYEQYYKHFFSATVFHSILWIISIPCLVWYLRVDYSNYVFVIFYSAKRRRHSVESDDASSVSEIIEIEEDEEAYRKLSST